MLVQRTECEDTINKINVEVHGHGKNFKPLVESGEWEISGFHYGHDKCRCCGRPISRVLHLKNRSHQAARDHIEGYAFPEEINIGIVCGPKVFQSSCAGFYKDAGKEWARQWQMWSQYVGFVMLCVQNRDIWDEVVPEDLRRVIDHYLEVDWKPGAETTANWWRIRDVKKRVLRTKRSSDRVPRAEYLRYNIATMIRTAQALAIVPFDWNVKLNASSKYGIEVYRG